MRAWKQTFQTSLACLLLLLAVPVIAWAAQSQSTNYRINEVFFGSGGNLEQCSNGATGYCAKTSAGDLAVGETCSNGTTGYCAQAGFNTDRTPYIEMEVSNTNVNLGSLSHNSTKTMTASFSVKAYLAHGYTVINASDPPTNNAYTMQALNIPTASSVGAEQFGINLVANTTPGSLVGDSQNPVQTPDNTFSFGAPSPDYSSANLYKYAKDDTIAFSTSSTSRTDYTISYIFNISPVTPGGIYSFHHVLVATGTY